MCPRGASRGPVVAVVDFDDSRVEQQGNQRYRIEMLRVFCSRDAVTGIDNPQDGDRFAQEGDDANVTAYAFAARSPTPTTRPGR
jgi:hypothetical protein